MNLDGAKCLSRHPLEIVNEGFGLCNSANSEEGRGWAIWSWAPCFEAGFWEAAIIGADGNEIPAWVRDMGDRSWGGFTREEALAVIESICNRRTPLTEEEERARLMPV